MVAHHPSRTRHRAFIAAGAAALFAVVLSQAPLHAADTGAKGLGLADSTHEASSDFTQTGESIRGALAARLRAGLAGIKGLTATEAARTVEVVNRYERAEPLSEKDDQLFRLAQKLVDGSIDLETFHAGASAFPRLPLRAPIGLAPKKPGFLNSWWIKGGLGAAVVGAMVALARVGGGGGHPAAGPATLADPPPPPPAP